MPRIAHLTLVTRYIFPYRNQASPYRRFVDMTILDFDEDQAGLIDTMYATPDVVAQRQFVLGLLDLKPTERVLDIGSGPGYLISEMGAAVGRDGAVHGLDASGAMNAIAARRCIDKPWVQIDEGDLLELPYADGTFDAAVSTQVYEYVADLPRALAELHRVLRPGGRALILDTDWDTLVWHTGDRALNRRITAAWDDHLVHPHLPRVLARLMRTAGFTVTAQRVHVLFNTELTDNSFSAFDMRAVAQYVPGHHGLTEADAAAWVADLQARSDAGEFFYSLNRYVVTATA
jgi:arsenite methyltransferase